MPNVAATAEPTRDAKFRDLVKERRVVVVLLW